MANLMPTAFWSPGKRKRVPFIERSYNRFQKTAQLLHDLVKWHCRSPHAAVEELPFLVHIRHECHFFHVGECIRIVASGAIFHGLPMRLLQYRAIEGE